MGLWRDLKLNEIVNVSGRGVSIDLIVDQIGGDDNTHRTALFLVGGLEEVKQKLTLSYADLEATEICDGFSIRIRDRTKYIGLGERVPARFDMHKDYKFLRRDNV